MSDDIREMGPIDWILIEFDTPLTGRQRGHCSTSSTAA